MSGTWNQPAPPSVLRNRPASVVARTTALFRGSTLMSVTAPAVSVRVVAPLVYVAATDAGVAHRTALHNSAARRYTEPLRARKGPALADRVPVPLSLRRVENPRPAGDVVARPVTRRPQPRRRIVQLDCRRPCNGCSEQDRREQDGRAGAQAFPPGFGNANTRRRGPQANRRGRRSAQAVGRRNRDSCAGSAAFAGKFLWGCSFCARARR